MTRAPATLMAARSLLLAELGKHGLASAEVGIVGDTAHVKQGNSYHLGLPEQARTGYAATESPRDKAGLSEYASALDIGSFSVRVAGKTHDLRSFSIWLVAQCKANTADTRDIREVIYSPDGRTVRRWDRLGRRSSGDDSHLWHTHISYFRDATKAGRDQTPLFRRYLTSIGLIAAPKPEDDMSERASRVIEAWAVGMPATSAKETVEPVKWRIRDEAWQKKTDATLAAVLAAAQGLDTDAILARINEVAAAETARDAELAQLVRAGQSGELDAAEVLRRMGEMLTAGSPPPQG